MAPKSPYKMAIDCEAYAGETDVRQEPHGQTKGS
jgi:hypothetical protein